MAGDSEQYTLGYGSGAMSWMKSRSVENHGAFILPWLKPDQCLLELDCGCGPGSLTLGFAQKLTEGQAIGVDLEISQCAEAQAFAAEQGITNLKFLQGSIYKLPFPDESFDVVFGSAVLGSLNDPLCAVEEMVRVVRKDGLICLKEFDLEGELVYPMLPLLEHSVELYKRIRQHNGHEGAGGRLVPGTTCP